MPLLASSGIPDPSGCVIAGGEPCAVGSDCHCTNCLAMPGELVALLTSGGVSQIRTVASSLVASQEPSGAIDTVWIGLRCPASWWRC